MFGNILSGVLNVGKGLLGGFLGGGALGSAGSTAGQIGQLASKFAGPAINALIGQNQMDQNFGFQREVLRNQLQWRAEDARKAGLHPTAALGIPAAGGFPVGSPGAAFDLANSAARRAVDPDRALRRDLLQAQIEETQSRTALNRAEALGRNGGARNNLPSTSPAGPSQPERTTIKRVIDASGKAMYYPSYMTTAQEIEDLFGGVAGEAAGVGNYSVVSAKQPHLRARYLRIPPPRPVRRSPRPARERRPFR